jgi:hypothetical protein
MRAVFALEAGWDKHRILETYLNLVSSRSQDGADHGDPTGAWQIASALDAGLASPLPAPRRAARTSSIPAAT